MRKMLVMFLSVATLALCWVGWTLPAWAAQKTLNLFIWSEYIDPKIPQEFEKATGIKVNITTYESNEAMMAKLQAGGDSEYDVIVPSSYVIKPLEHLHLVQKLNHSLIPNLKNLKKMFRNSPNDPGNVYSVAYQWGTTGLLYRKDKVKNFQNTWGLLFNEKMNQGPFYLIDDERSMMGIALLYLGYPFNSTDPAQLKKAADLLVKVKKYPDCLGFRGGVGAKNDVVAGTAVAAIVYNGDAAKAINKNKNIPMAYTIPKEGSEIWYDNMMITDKAPHPKAANEFINFILSPKIGAQLSDYNEYATPNEASMPYIDKGDHDDPAIYPSEAVLKTLHTTRDLGEKMKLLDAAWTRAKS
ncbi:MAG: polyamine ABC transporter substrate-binding protein [Syntrophobacteraceae bacterium]